MAPCMRIFVKTPGKIASMELQPSCTIKDVKEIIYEEESIPVEEQRLIIAGKQLDDGCTLSNSDIKVDSTIALLFRLRGGYGLYNVDLHIYRRNPADDRYCPIIKTIEIPKPGNLEELKRKLLERLGNIPDFLPKNTGRAKYAFQKGNDFVHIQESNFDELISIFNQLPIIVVDFDMVDYTFRYGPILRP